MGGRDHVLDLGMGQMGGEPASRLAEIGRRKPGFAVAQADQQYLVPDFSRGVFEALDLRVIGLI